jgi:hypothetical protein
MVSSLFILKNSALKKNLLSPVLIYIFFTYQLNFYVNMSFYFIFKL